MAKETNKANVMSNELTILNNEEFGQVRMVQDGERILFCGHDVAKALGYAKPANAISQHCKGTLKQGTLTNGGFQELSFIPEGDVYRLISRSKLPSAEKFEKWVFDEVLPSIRKHGAYLTTEVLEKTLLNPDYLITLANTIKEERAKNLVLITKIENDEPFVTFAKTCQKSKDNILVRQLAKIAFDEGLPIGEKKLYTRLRYWGLILDGSTEPSQRGMNSGYFVVSEKSVNTMYGTKLVNQTYVTPKGQIFIIEKLKKELSLVS